MEKFKDLPIDAVAFIGPVFMRKTGANRAQPVLGFTEQQVDPETEIEMLKSIDVKGKKGSAFKQTYGK